MMRDGSLCVGSPYSVARALRADPSVMGFVNKLVVPYLFGHASQSRGLTLPFGQLAHGVAGLEAEMCEELRLGRSGEVSKFLALAGQRRRVANQDACYCGSGNLLRSCHADVVNRFREEVGQKWCRTYAATFASSRSR